MYATNQDCPEHKTVMDFIQELSSRKDIVICDLVLVELYLLLLNPAVLSSPLTSQEATRTCLVWRSNSNWRVVEAAPVMKQVWDLTVQQNIPRRRIIDARLAYTLIHHGVEQFVTRNTKDFADLGFEKLINPID
jgi:toxin-antitoxin system PIN domain toxin